MIPETLDFDHDPVPEKAPVLTEEQLEAEYAFSDLVLDIFDCVVRVTAQ